MSLSAPVIDVRSPSEYGHASIPGAFSLPLFTDDERAIVGTLYKQKGKQAAIKSGLDFFGPKMTDIIAHAEKIAADYKPETPFLVHCWRGGMRSAGIAWLLELYGFKVVTLQGGYKSYRRFALDWFQKTIPMRVIGGYTGSGKTAILSFLQQHHEPVIDLEALAHHKGSAFGHLGEAKQPSQEQFENNLAYALWKCFDIDQAKYVWVEDESQRIGAVNLPINVFNQKQSGELYFLDIPFEERLKTSIALYGAYEKEQLINAILRIQKRLGGLETKTAISALIDGDTAASFAILLRYYDKYYGKSLLRKEKADEQMVRIPCATASPDNGRMVLQESIKRNNGLTQK